MLTIEIVLGSGSLEAVEAWWLFHEASVIAARDGLPIEWKLRNARVSSERVAATLKRTKREEFEAESAIARVTFTPVPRFGIIIASVEKLETEADVGTWVQPFLAVKGFRGARLYDEEYEFWQNAEDLLQYRTRGRSYEHLPLKSNGLPPPLESVVVDISRNPGRRVIREGVVEAVGSEMWFGLEFWHICGSNRTEVQSQEWLSCGERSGGVLHSKAASHAFRSMQGQEGALQDRLRRLLFPTWNKG